MRGTYTTFWNMVQTYETWTIGSPSGIFNFYLWKQSINHKKRGSSKVGMLYFSKKIMNMFALVHSFGMQMVEFCEKELYRLVDNMCV